MHKNFGGKMELIGYNKLICINYLFLSICYIIQIIIWSLVLKKTEEFS